MKLRLNLTPRITLVFVLFAAALLAGVGWLSYNSGRATLQAAATSELLSAAIEKETPVNGWVDERLADLEGIAASPRLRVEVARLAAAPASPLRPLLRQGVARTPLWSRKCGLPSGRNIWNCSSSIPKVEKFWPRPMPPKKANRNETILTS